MLAAARALMLLGLAVLGGTRAWSADPAMHWSKLAPLPDREGFAGMFAGVSGGALIAAGGANFPEKRPWEGGTKMWYREVWVLENPAGEWRSAGTLAEPRGYGVSATWRDEVICAGGSNADGHTAAVFALRWAGGKLTRRELPPLPRPCANACGAMIGDVLHISGGIERPDSVAALASFWSLDLSRDDAAWRELPPWPGSGRMLATAGSLAGSFYLFSGAALHADREGKPERDWLRDAYRYLPGAGWEKLPDLPRAAIAAPSPAPAFSTGLLVLTGDDGSKLGFKPETAHPGFPRNAMLFDAAARAWRVLGDVPFSRATVPVAPWAGGFAIPSGEERPGYRSNEVWMLRAE